MQSSRLVRAVFVVLTLATVAAFFVSQSFKTDTPAVLRFTVPTKPFSPNGDGLNDFARVGFDLSEPTDVTFSVIDKEGNEVRRLADDEPFAGDARHRLRFDGRDDNGDVLADGTYRLRIVRRNEGRSLDSQKTVEIDTAGPRVRVASVEPGVVDPGDGRVRVRATYEGPRNALPEFRVWRTEGGRVRVIRRFRGDGDFGGTWGGLTSGGNLAVDGNYVLQARVRDRAGNDGVAPGSPPSAETVPPGGGLAIRRLTLKGPLGVVGAGDVAALAVGPTPRRFSFTLARVGSRRLLERGRRSGQALRVRIPAGSRTGLFTVRVRSRGLVASWPLVINGVPVARRAVGRPRPLVVLPVVTWQGENPFDSDLDGFADTLSEGTREFAPERPFDGGRLPRGLLREAAPLLRFLDRERLPYDLTTDLALARREGPALGNAPGVAIAGTAIWLPRSVRDGLRREVEEGGRTVVSFGRESLRRTVALSDGRLRDPSPPRPDDLFGERTSLFRSDPPAPLVAEGDELGLFSDVDSLFGEFSLFERSDTLPEGARLRSAAGRDEDEPAFVAYRLGEGTVIRPGTPEWAAALEEEALGVEVPQVMRRIWALLGRG